MMIGPHSPFASNSLMMISETQQNFAMKVIEMWRRDEVQAISPTYEATERFNAERRSAYTKTIWASGCSSWYDGKDGLPHVWPWLPKEHRRALAKVELSDWEVQPAPRLTAKRNTEHAVG